MNISTLYDTAYEEMAIASLREKFSADDILKLSQLMKQTRYEIAQENLKKAKLEVKNEAAD